MLKGLKSPSGLFVVVVVVLIIQVVKIILFFRQKLHHFQLYVLAAGNTP